MGYVPPPPPLSDEEFHRRFEAGARTIAEIDPELDQWMKECRLYRRSVKFCFLMALAAAAILALAFPPSSEVRWWLLTLVLIVAIKWTLWPRG